MKKEIYIYGLFSEDENIRYVGKTNKVDITKRLRQHILNSKNKKTHRDQWIQKCLSENKEIKIKLIETCDESNWQDREKYWIKFYRENSKLTNHSDGGESGHGIIYTKSYDEVKEWVQNNTNIKSSNDWEKQIKIINKPIFIPNDPRQSYLNRGWISWGDFLGTNNKYDNNVNYLSYDEAKKYIKENLANIKLITTWKKYVKNNLIPESIPNRPDRYYINKNRGWISWGDFLGTNRVANQNKNFLKYDECKIFILKLNIKSISEWHKYWKNNVRPNFIPSNPNKEYKNKGWTNWGDFLGTNKISDNKKHENYFSYEDSKKYLNENYNFIKSSCQWKKFIKQNIIPKKIPENPQLSYKNKGWNGWGEFLNTGNIMNKLKKFPEYNETKEIIKKYNLKTNKDWREFSKKEGKSLGLPSAPERTYKNKGWISWQDFLRK